MVTGIDGKRVAGFLFGSRWWTLWHAFITLLLVPFAAVAVWLMRFEPGAGAQGGDVMAGFLLIYVLGEAPATFVHTMLFAWTRSDREAGQLLKFLAIWAVAFALFTAALWIMVEIAAQSSAGSAGRAAGVLLAIALVVALHGAGLMILEHFRRWRTAGGVL